MRLRRTNLSDPGITRQRHGRGFSYRGPDGLRLEDEQALARCRKLVIPPAWKEVWICPYPNGHIQAIGIDNSGRKQYIYHQVWHDRMALEKFDRMLDLADVIPQARRGVTRDLRTESFTRERVLAGAFRMMDASLLRVGSETYAREHGSIGLTTLLGQHAHVHDRRIVHLCFPGKSGQPWESQIDDPDLARLISALKLRGPDAALMAWCDDNAGSKVWRTLTASEINAEVRRRTGGEFTAKDFRTLHGTIIAAGALATTQPTKSVRGRQRAIAEATRLSAEKLGNTPTVARNSYIDPRVFDAYEAGRMIDPKRQVEGQLRSLFE